MSRQPCFLATLGVTLGLTVLIVLSAAAARAQTPYPDVPREHWGADAVGKLYAAGILKGYPQGGKPAAPKAGYNGNKPVTRYELAVVLWRFVQYVERAGQQKRGNSRVQAEPKTGQEAVRRLIAGGYLPANTPLAKEGGTAVTANQLANAFSQVLVRTTEKKTPVTPDSERAPLQKPTVPH